MPQRSAAKSFETALYEAVFGLFTGKIQVEPTIGPIATLLHLMVEAGSPDPMRSQVGEKTLYDLHCAYQCVKAHDDSSEFPKKPRRVTRFKDEYLPPELFRHRDYMRQMWPLLPLIDSLWRARNDGHEAAPGMAARLIETIFVLLCTKPDFMRAHLYGLALDVISRNRRFPGLDAGDAADKVVRSFEQRALPVARYEAKATTIEEAARAVRTYMTQAIRRRFNDVVRALLEPELDVSANRLRRWGKQGIRPENPVHADSIKEAMKQRQKHVTEGRSSLAGVARETGWSRPRVTKALRQAEAEDGFVAEVKDGTTLLTQSQVKRVKALLGRKARPPG